MRAQSQESMKFIDTKLKHSYRSRLLALVLAQRDAIQRDHLLHCLRIPLALNVCCINCNPQRLDVLRRENDLAGLRVLFKTRDGAGAGNRYEVRVLRDDPREGELSYGHAIPLCCGAEFIDKLEILGEVLVGHTGHVKPDVGRSEVVARLEPA